MVDTIKNQPALEELLNFTGRDCLNEINHKLQNEKHAENTYQFESSREQNSSDISISS